ncbi:EIPR1 [Mytilus coruscus]|uniref:EIPR1 n=1 Tax=Mytilus coruscus TaxID=42192 RepID=A0A6J8B0M1_MYTCO|nr:EIPR1 [Mytilus coruscus]
MKDLWKKHPQDKIHRGMGSGVSKSTAVANAFLHDIYVKCEGDLNFNSEEWTKYSLEVNNTLMAFTKQKEFYPNCSKRVYLTIIHPDEDNFWKILCCMYEIPENQNVVVVHSGSVKVTKGHSHWVDKEGYNHKNDVFKLLNYQNEVKELKEQHKREISEIRKKHGVPKSSPSS